MLVPRKANAKYPPKLFISLQNKLWQLKIYDSKWYFFLTTINGTWLPFLWYMHHSWLFLYTTILAVIISGCHRVGGPCPGSAQTTITYQRKGVILHWRHNDHDGVSNHQPHGCLLNRLFRRRSKKTSKLRVTGLCVGNSPGPVSSPHKGPVTRKMFPFDDVIMECSWLVHGLGSNATQRCRLRLSV